MTGALVACGGSTEGGDFEEPSGGSAGTSANGGTAAGGAAGQGSGGAATGGTGVGGVAGGTSGGAAGTGTAGGAAGTGTGGSGGSVCGGPIASCFESRTVTIDRECIDPTQPLTFEQCTVICPTETLDGTCGVASYDDESIVVDCHPCAAAGRRPAGFTASIRRDRSLAAELANMAVLEAVSVHAFRDLRAELRGFGAPRSLQRRLGNAARDEVRHARTTRALARRFGGSVQVPQKPMPQRRSLEQIARENAIEGCLRETFGALVAHYQSSRAKDPELRAAFTRIARDETRHAALSWSLHAWLEKRLDRAARERVKAAQQTAAKRLYAELGAPAAEDPASLAGLPSSEAARLLFRKAFPALWA